VRDGTTSDTLYVTNKVKDALYKLKGFGELEVELDMQLIKSEYLRKLISELNID